jgi:hypothetical protein
MSTTTSGWPARVPAAATLDKWTAHDWSHGVLITALAPHDRLVVRTHNSTYEIVVLVPQTASVLVRGGLFFPDFTPAHVAGSSLGGSLLKLHGVCAGFHLELVAAKLPVVTTRVRTVALVPPAHGDIM